MTDGVAIAIASTVSTIATGILGVITVIVTRRQNAKLDKIEQKMTPAAGTRAIPDRDVTRPITAPQPRADRPIDWPRDT